MAEHDAALAMLAKLGASAVPVVQVPIHPETVPVVFICQAGSQLHASEIVQQALREIEGGEISIHDDLIVIKIP